MVVALMSFLEAFIIFCEAEKRVVNKYLGQVYISSVIIYETENKFIGPF